MTDDSFLSIDNRMIDSARMVLVTGGQMYVTSPWKAKLAEVLQDSVGSFILIAIVQQYFIIASGFFLSFLVSMRVTLLLPSPCFSRCRARWLLVTLTILQCILPRDKETR